MADQLYATLRTSMGEINLRLFPEYAPNTVRNFVDLAQGNREWVHPGTRQKTTERLYDGTLFHRIIPNFMIQGGDPLGNGRGGPGYEFANEQHPELTFDRKYLLAMANAGRDTNGSQFFITVAVTEWLTGDYTIFGEVADQPSRGVVDRIATTPTNPTNDRPLDDVVLESVTIHQQPA